jgi:hypothetical protein
VASCALAPKFFTHTPKLFEELLPVYGLAALNLSKAAGNFLLDFFPAVILTEVTRNM